MKAGWIGGIAASFAAHAGLAAVLAAAVAPDPQPPPAPREVEFNIAGYPVPEATAAAAELPGQDVPPASAVGRRAAGRAVPQSHARPRAPDTHRMQAASSSGNRVATKAPGSAATTVAQAARPAALVARDSGGTQLAPLQSNTPLVARPVSAGAPIMTGTPLPAVDSAPLISTQSRPTKPATLDVGRPAATRPAGGAVNALAPSMDAPSVVIARADPVQLTPTSGPRLAGAISARDPVSVAGIASAKVFSIAARFPVLSPHSGPDRPSSATVPVATGGTLANVAVPPSVDLSQARLSSPSVQTAASDGELHLGTPLPSRPAPSRQPPTQFQTAALAWTGDRDAALDAVALAAIAAFGKAGDPGGAGPRMRDAIGALLAQVPCARLQTVFDPASGALQLRGHIPDDGLRAPVLTALKQQLGAAIPVVDAMLILPRPQCDALARIAGVGLAQSDEQIGDPRVVGERPFADIRQFSEGQLMRFEVQGPDYPAHVYVDYFDADGQVIHLQPNDQVPLRRLPARATMTVGLNSDDRPAFDIRVAPPFGQEIMVTFASSTPLYSGFRPMVEPAEAYLGFLEQAVAAARTRNPDFRGEWFYFLVATGPLP